MKSIRLKASGDPRPYEDRAAKRPANRPQSNVAREDPERARQDRGRRLDLTSLNQEASRDARKIFRDQRAEHEREEGQHVRLPVTTSKSADSSARYRSSIARPVTLTNVWLTVGASARSILTLM